MQRQGGILPSTIAVCACGCFSVLRTCSLPEVFFQGGGGGKTIKFVSVLERRWSRDSSFGIATGYVLDDRGVGVRVPVGSRIFSMSSRSAVGPTQPPIQWVPEALSPGEKRPGREAGHSPATSATPPYALVA
jgi:hypothetical protein